MSENKDAQYREEARIALREARDGLSIEDAYLAGRKKGEEEFDTAKPFVDMYWQFYQDRCEGAFTEVTHLKNAEKEIESLKRIIQNSSKVNESLKDRLKNECEMITSAANKEIESLKKEIEGLKSTITDKDKAYQMILELNKEWDKLANEQVDKNKELKKELDQQRFNNKHNLSIDSVVSDEIESLKKEIKELELRNKHNLSTDLSSYKELCRINSDYDKENKKLRELVERAKPWVIAMDDGHCIPEYMQWQSESEELLK